MKNADNIIVLPIYASSEQPIDGIDDEYVYQQLKSINPNTQKCELDEEKLFQKILQIVDTNKTHVVVFMGAGKGPKLAHIIAEISKEIK